MSTKHKTETKNIFYTLVMSSWMIWKLWTLPNPYQIILTLPVSIVFCNQSFHWLHFVDTKLWVATSDLEESVSLCTSAIVWGINLDCGIRTIGIFLETVFWTMIMYDNEWETKEMELQLRKCISLNVDTWTLLSCPLRCFSLSPQFFLAIIMGMTRDASTTSRLLYQTNTVTDTSRKWLGKEAGPWALEYHMETSITCNVFITLPGTDLEETQGMHCSMHIMSERVLLIQVSANQFQANFSLKKLY